MLKKITDLSQGRGIDDELKKIAESLGLAVRSTLVHPEVEPRPGYEFEERAEDDVLADVLQRFKEKAKAIEAAAAPEQQIAPRPMHAMRKRAMALAGNDSKQPDEARKSFHTIAVRLFVWLVTHDHKDKLDGLPAVSRAASSEQATLLKLPDEDSGSDDIPLAPVDCWPEGSAACSRSLPATAHPV